MPRRKATIENDDQAEASARKIQRVARHLPLPTIPQNVGVVLVCGQGDVGQLGLGEDERKFERKKPVPLTYPVNVVDICAGGMHNLVLTKEGKVYSFGCNDEGALGRIVNEIHSEFEPFEVELPGKAIKMSAGDSHSACLLEDGRVFAWGSFRDSHGNMGLTLEGNKMLPSNILSDKLFCDIASGADHLVLLSQIGTVFTVGCAEQGQLGRVSIRSASGESRRGKTDLLFPGPVYIKRSKPIKSVWATKYCTFLQESVTENIFAFGLNNYNQLITNNQNNIVNTPVRVALENVKQIAGGQHHTLVLTNEGHCYSIGRHDYGRLGLGAVTTDLTVLRRIMTLSDQNIVKISCGEAQSFALTDNGKLYSWGMGSNLQLGTGSEQDVLEPVLINSNIKDCGRIIEVSSGGQHSIFLKEIKSQSIQKKLVPVSTEDENLKQNGRLDTDSKT